MTQENKQMLLRDLAARLPFHCRVKVVDSPLDGIHLTPFVYSKVEIGEWTVMPYLYRLTSIDEKEIESFGKMLGTASYRLLRSDYLPLIEVLNFNYSRHFDMNNLIEKGLAIEVTEYNNPYKSDRGGKQ